MSTRGDAAPSLATDLCGIRPRNPVIAEPSSAVGCVLGEVLLS